MALKYVIYARKSSESEDRQVLSIESQLNELKELSKKSNIIIGAIQTESKSAKAPGRAIFNQLLDDVENKNTQGIIVWNPDRLSRNSVDTGRLIYLFDIGRLHELVTPTQVFRNTPNDKFLLNLLCSQAKLENDNKGVNVKRGLKTKAERGMYPGPAVLGYRNEKYAEKGNRSILVDEDRFPLVRRMWDLMLTGNYTVMDIIRIANKDWKFTMPQGGKFGRTTAYNLFSRTFYYGMYEYPRGSGLWHHGIHRAIITEEEYDIVQVLLGKKGKPRPKTHIFAFGGMMRCGECKSMITAETKVKRQKNGNIHHYVYYHCTKRKNPDCTQRCIEEKELKAQIKSAINEISIPPEFHEWAMHWLEKENAKEFTTHTAVLKTHQKNQLAAITKTRGLIDMRAKGLLNDEQFLREMPAAEKEETRYKQLIDDSNHAVRQWVSKAKDIITFSRDAQEKFETGSFEEKRAILTKLGSNLIIADKKLRVDLENSLIPMKLISKEVKEIHVLLEPLKNKATTEEYASVYAKNPILLRR